MRGQPFLSSRAGGSGLHFHHHRLRAIDQSFREERVQTEDGGGSKTPGTRNAVGAPHLSPVKFRNTVDKALQQVGPGMIVSVPSRVRLRVTEAKVSAQVDY